MQPPQQPPAPSSMFVLLKAPGAPGGPGWVPGRPVCCSCDVTMSARDGQKYLPTYLVILPNLPHEVSESLVDVDSLLGGGLDKFAAEVLGKIATLCGSVAPQSIRSAHTSDIELLTVHAHLALVFEIALVGDDDHGELIHVLDPQDLLIERADFFKRVARRDGVYQQEAFASSHVLLPHGPCEAFRNWKNLMGSREHSPVFFLPSRVQHIKKGYLVVNDALLAIRVCQEGARAQRACKQETSKVRQKLCREGRLLYLPSIVGSYSSTKWL